MEEQKENISATEKTNKPTTNYIVCETFDGTKSLEDTLIQLVRAQYCKSTGERV